MPNEFRLRVQPGWYLGALALTVALAMRYFPLEHPWLPSTSHWAMAVAGVLALIASIVAHELAHALVAHAHGVATHGVTLAMVGGRAEVERAMPTPRGEIALAVAGPLANAALAGIAAATWHWWPAWSESAVGVLAFVIRANVLLAVVNLLPVFPLDGGRVLRALLWRPAIGLVLATRRAARVGLVVSGVIVFGGALTAVFIAPWAGVFGVVTGLYLYLRAWRVR
jgi:Zn-dependent protease